MAESQQNQGVQLGKALMASDGHFRRYLLFQRRTRRLFKRGIIVASLEVGSYELISADLKARKTNTLRPHIALRPFLINVNCSLGL